MKITRRTDYAIHLIAELAESSGKPMGLRAMAERHNVTYAFARTIQRGLLKAGIIKTARGVNGGVVLQKGLDEITLLEVFEAAQEPLASAFTTKDAVWCPCDEECFLRPVWNSTRDVLKEHFSGITMQHVLKAPKTQ